MWSSHCPAHRIRALPDESVCHDTGIPDELAGAEASAIMTKRILYLLSYIIGVVLIRMAVVAAFTSKHLTDRIHLKRLLDHILGGIYGVLRVLFFAWLALYFCNVLSDIPSVNMSLRMIQASKILSILESHNPFRIFL